MVRGPYEQRLHHISLLRTLQTFNIIADELTHIHRQRVENICVQSGAIQRRHADAELRNLFNDLVVS
jgi:hypothetical protein